VFAAAALVALLSVPAGAVLASSSVSPEARRAPVAPLPASSDTVRLGSSGFRVLQVQYVLRSLGNQISVDGHFGKQTDATVKSFQASRQLKADGIVGPATAAALGLSATAAAPAAAPAAAAAPAPAPGSYRHPNAKVERWHADALAAGFAEDDWQRLSCIISRESGGDPAAKNRSSSATGLLQIMWTVHSKWIGGSSTQLLDGPTNLRLGRQLFLRSGSWAPWKSTVNAC